MENIYILYISMLLIGIITCNTAPSNTIAMSGETVEFECNRGPESAVIWFKTILNKVFNIEEINSDNRFSVDQNNGSLFINNVKSSDAAKYSCRDTTIVTSKQLPADLYVIDNLRMDVKVVSEKGISRDTNNIHDNDKVSVKCLSDFYLTGGLRPDRYPTIGISLNFKSLTVTSASTVLTTERPMSTISSNITYTVKPSDYQFDIKCYVISLYPKFKDNQKDHILDRVFKVNKPITHVTYKPMSKTYKIGDKLNCTSDGWPIPIYKWVPDKCSGNCHSQSGPILEINTDNIGENKYTCIAKQQVSSAKSKSITVDFTVYDNSKKDITPNVKSGNGWKIAVGILVPLVVICIIAAIVFTILRRRKQKASNVPSKNNIQSKSTNGLSGPYGQSMDIPVVSTGGDISTQYPGKNTPGYADMGVRHLNSQKNHNSNPRKQQQQYSNNSNNNTTSPPHQTGSSSRTPSVQQMPMQEQRSRNPSLSSAQTAAVQMSPTGRPSPQPQQRRDRPPQQQQHPPRGAR